MSKLQSNHLFTSESVSEGHRDKVCDQVSDAILDACLAEAPSSKVACETAVTTNFLINWEQTDKTQALADQLGLKERCMG